MNWTIFGSVIGVAVIFAAAWTQSRYHKERIEMEEKMSRNKEESVERFNINKTQIEILKTRLGNFEKTLDDVKISLAVLDKKIDRLIEFLPKRSTNHISPKD